jgi:putative transposase
MNCQFVHTLPGTTFSNPTDRGDYDSEGKAIYTIEKFQERFNEWLEGFYHNNPQGPDKCSPNQRWDASIAHQLPPEKFFAKDLDRLLRLIERRTISGGCVTFLELSWSGPGLAEMEQRLKKNEKAYIYYDPSNLLEVFVSLPDRPDDLFRAKGTRPEYQANLTLFEHNLVLNELKKNNTDLTTKLADYTLWQNRQKIAFDIENFMSCKTKNNSRQRNKNSTNDRAVDHSSLMRSKTSSHQAEAESKEFDTFYVSEANYEQHKRNP